MVAVPSGTVTFLLTDVEGSTPLWSAEPARMGTGICPPLRDPRCSGHGSRWRASRGARGGRQRRCGLRSTVRCGGRGHRGADPSDRRARLVAGADGGAHGGGRPAWRGNYVGTSIIACARIRSCASWPADPRFGRDRGADRRLVHADRSRGGAVEGDPRHGTGLAGDQRRIADRVPFAARARRPTTQPARTRPHRSSAVNGSSRRSGPDRRRQADDAHRSRWMR